MVLISQPLHPLILVISPYFSTKPQVFTYTCLANGRIVQLMLQTNRIEMLILQPTKKAQT